MKSHLYTVVIFILCISANQLSAQSVDAIIKKANKEKQNLAFQEAIELYEQALTKEIKPDALFALPDCYRRVGNHLKADEWYAKAAEHPEAPSDIFFYYGMSLLSNEKMDEARAMFSKFRDMENAQLRAHNMVKACNTDFHKELLHAGALFDVMPVEQMNTKYDDLGASFFGDDLLFWSDRDTAKISTHRGSWLHKPFIQTYMVPVSVRDKDTKSFNYGTPTSITPFSLNYHDGPLRFDGSEQIAYYTMYGTNEKKSNHLANILNTQIAEIKQDGEQWSKPSIKLTMNSREYSVAHPCVIPDGDKMFFASDIPGGFGGFDLYVCYHESEGWSRPINLGPEVNTEGDEIYPFYSEDKHLYFSSDGQPGLGGFDIYYTRSHKGIWASVTNLGFPLNSVKDEISIVMDSSCSYGYFSSNRVPARNMDIYYFKRVALESQILVFDKATGQGVADVEIVSDCLPKSTDFVTNIDGRIFAPLPLNRNCKLMLKSEDFASTEKDVSTIGYAPGAELFINIPLQLKEAVFKLQGFIQDANSSIAIVDARVSLVNGCGIE